MKLLLFDVDQTLISTGGAGIRALNRAFEHLFSLQNAMEGILPHGKTDPGIIREIFTTRTMESGRDGYPTSLEPILNSYLTYLKEEVESSASYKVLPGIEDFLDSMTGRSDVLVGLATGNVEAGARIKLARGNLNRHFAFGGFGSDFEDRSLLVKRGAETAAAFSGQRFEPSKTFVIGDTPRDIEAGREAGFQTVGVATGKYSRSDLVNAGATVAIHNFEVDRDQFLRTTRIV